MASRPKRKRVYHAAERAGIDHTKRLAVVEAHGTLTIDLVDWQGFRAALNKVPRR